MLFAKKRRILTLVTAVVAAVLLVMVGLHAIDLDHEHPEMIFGHGPQVLVHAQSEKWLFAFLLAVIVFWTFRFSREDMSRLLFHEMLFYGKFELIDESELQMRPLLAYAYSNGILNTKRY